MRHTDLYNAFMLRSKCVSGLALCMFARLHVWGYPTASSTGEVALHHQLDQLMLHKQAIDPVSAQLSLDFVTDLYADRLHLHDFVTAVAERLYLPLLSAIELGPVFSPPQSLSLSLVHFLQLSL